MTREAGLRKNEKPVMSIVNILSIAGTDPSGGAGMQADLKAIGAMGGYAMSVVTAIVAQNTQGVRAVSPVPPEMIAQQLDAVFQDVRVDAVKIGMVGSPQAACVIADRLQHYGAQNIVLDPVMVAQSGDSLAKPETTEALRSLLSPLATVITPNLPEAAALLKSSVPQSLDDMTTASKDLRALGSKWVLLKGGHSTCAEESFDVLCGENACYIFSSPRLETKNNHGTGCTLAASIAALLPFCSVKESVYAAKAFLFDALQSSRQLDVGKGHGPLNHLCRQIPMDRQLALQVHDCVSIRAN